jgi:hypothetical protein
MHPVAEVHVRNATGPEHDRGPGGLAEPSVTRPILGPEICLGLDDDAAPAAMYEHAADERARDDARVAAIEPRR